MIRMLRAALLTCALLIAPSAVSAGSSSDSQIANLIENALHSYAIPGAAVALIENGVVTATYYSGVTRVDAQAQQITESTVFQVASISKPITATAVLQLVQQGILDLDTPIATYLSRWQLPRSDSDTRGVTLRRLLSHTAGLSLGGYPGFHPDTPRPTLEANLSGDTNGAGAVYLMATPGSAYAYSGGGYTLLQLIIEETTGQDFANYMQRAVLTPLDMGSSSFDPAANLLARTAAAHGRSLNIIPGYRFTAVAAAGLHTTVGDLAKFVTANLGEHPLLNVQHLAVMQAPTALLDGLSASSLGFQLSGGGQIVGHGGSNKGWRADIKFAPGIGAGLVVLTNSDTGSELIADLSCYWDATYGPNQLSNQCSMRTKVQTLTSYTPIYLSGLAIFSLAAFWRSYLTHRRRLSIPSSGLRWLAGILLIVFVGSWLTFFYTPLGARLLYNASIWGPTINYAPFGFEYVSWALLAALFTLALWIFSR